MHKLGQLSIKLASKQGIYTIYDIYPRLQLSKTKQNIIGNIKHAWPSGCMN